MMEPKTRIELTTYASRVRSAQILTQAGGEKDQSIWLSKPSLWRRCLVLQRSCAVQSLKAGVSVILVTAAA